MSSGIESHEKQMEDSDIIFTAISSAGYESIEDAKRIAVLGYVTDMSFSRAGISHALKRLEKFYNERMEKSNAKERS